ncbi:MAG: 50S ribosomal protein L29 [Patescibacteria group bacterium]
MKIKDIKALHEKKVSELKQDLQKIEQELVVARLERKVGKLANPSKVARLADDVARIKTAIRELELTEVAVEEPKK